VTIRPKSQQNPLCKPQRLSGLSLGIAAALMSLAGASQAAELQLENGWSGSLNTTVSVGTSIRAQEQDPGLYSAGSGAAVDKTVTGTGGSNTDSGNLNYDKGDAFSTLLKVSSDLSLSKGDAGIFARVKAWYDYALKDQKVNAGNHANGWSTNSKLSDSGFDNLQKFSGVALLDAYVYNSYEVDGKPLQVRLGNQVINWGESLFIQGINVVNPIDLSALRKPGAEIKDAFLPVPSLSFNLGLGEGKSLEGFYQFATSPSNIDSCGTYFGVVETQLTTSGGKACSQVLTTLSTSFGNSGSFAANQYLPMTNGDNGDDAQFGIALRLPIESMDADLGLYAAQITSRTPYVGGYTGSDISVVTGGAILNYYPGAGAAYGSGVLAAFTAANNPNAAAIAAAATQAVNAAGTVSAEGAWVYPSKVDVFGLSLATNLSGWSVGTELSHSPNYPVQINAADIVAGAISGIGPFAATVESAMDAPGTELNGFDRVAKTQVQVNAIKIFTGVMKSAQGVFAGELAFQHADVPSHRDGGSQRYGRAFIFGQGYHPTLSSTEATEAGWCANENTQQDGCKNDGFVTKNSWGYRLRLGLEYPGFMGTSATFYPTISFSHDVKGYSVDNQFIEDRQTLGLSGRWNINKVHNVEVSYVRYGDQAKYDPFRDRDFYSLVLSTTF
jgi:hypothetical protein